MTTIELIFRLIKALIEVAGFAYFGQAIIGLVAGAKREQNLFYSIFKVLTGPISRVVRMVTPRFVPDKHVPFVAFGILIWAWVAVIFALAYIRANGI